MAIYSEFFPLKNGDFSIAMLVYQRVETGDFFTGKSRNGMGDFFDGKMTGNQGLTYCNRQWNVRIVRMEEEILHHQKDGWNMLKPIQNNELNNHNNLSTGAWFRNHPLYCPPQIEITKW